MKRKRMWKNLKNALVFSLRDCLITLGCFSIAAALCFLLMPISESDAHVPLVFVLALLVISTTTKGYLYGLVGSVIAVFGVNYAFTFPYFHFNFFLTGYPLTFICMFAVSVIACTMTSRFRESEALRIEAEKEKMRANLLRAISHDFRTPLTGMIGSINVVRENYGSLPESDVKTLLGDAKSEAEWLINMVENLLSITRIGADPGASLHRENQLAEEVMGEAVSRFRRQYPQLKVRVSIPRQILVVPMDAVLVEQVIINLLINAAIHGKGASEAVLAVEQSGGFAVFSVSDNGCGIPPEKLSSLFDGGGLGSPRTSGSDSTRTMGIGLSVCKTIISAHGGSMLAENLPEGGARLSFTMPLAT